MKKILGLLLISTLLFTGCENKKEETKLSKQEAAALGKELYEKAEQTMKFPLETFQVEMLGWKEDASCPSNTECHTYLTNFSEFLDDIFTSKRKTKYIDQEVNIVKNGNKYEYVKNEELPGNEMAISGYDIHIDAIEYDSIKFQITTKECTNNTYIQTGQCSVNDIKKTKHDFVIVKVNGHWLIEEITIPNTFSDL